METLVPQTQELGAINMVSIKSSALANASTHARFFFLPNVCYSNRRVSFGLLTS